MAKEFAQEITEDMSSIFGEDLSDVRSAQDVIKKLMSDLSKISGLVKTISDKLTKKMENGDISQEEMLREATGVFNKMQGMAGDNAGLAELLKKIGGGDAGDADELMKTMTNMMGGGNAGAGIKDLMKMVGGVMGGAKPQSDKPKTAMQSTRERLKARMMQKKISEAEEFMRCEQKKAQQKAIDALTLRLRCRSHCTAPPHHRIPCHCSFP